MNVTGWDWWIVVGGALQIAGVVLLVVDIIRGFARIEEYRKRPQVVEVGTIEVGATVFPVSVIGGQQPTTDERLDRLEKKVSDLAVEFQETAGELKRVAREAASDAGAAASRHSDRSLGALERALLGDTPRDRWRRLLSVAAIVVGVALATIGSVAP